MNYRLGVKMHVERMKEILKRSPEDCANILVYISGSMGDDEKFEKAFQSALLDEIDVE